MSTTTQLASLTRFKTGTNSTTFTDADMLLLANLFIKEISSQIVERNAGFFLVPATFNLVANQREYAFPDDTLNRIQRLEVKFDSTSSRFPSQYVKEYSGSETESEIVKLYSNSEGMFRHTIRRRALFLLSGTIISVTDGGRLWYHAYPADLSALNGSTDMSIDPSTTTFGFPRQFHELLARRISIEWKGSRNPPLPLSRHEINYENDLKIQLDAISHPDNSAEIVGDSLSTTDTGNNGFSY